MAKKKDIIRFWRKLKVPPRIITRNINTLIKITEKSITIMTQNLKRQIESKRESSQEVDLRKYKPFEHVLIYYIAYFIIREETITREEKISLIPELFNYSIRRYAQTTQYPYSFEFPSQNYVYYIAKNGIDINLYNMLLARDFFATKDMIYDNFKRVLSSDQINDKQKALYYILLIDYISEYIIDPKVHQDITNTFLNAKIDEEIKKNLVYELIKNPILDYTALSLGNDVIDSLQKMRSKLISSEKLNENETQMLKNLSSLLAAYMIYRSETPTLFSLFDHVRGTMFKFYGIRDSFKFAFQELLLWYLATKDQKEIKEEVKKQVELGVSHRYSPRIVGTLQYIYKNINSFDETFVKKIIKDVKSIKDPLVLEIAKLIKNNYKSNKLKRQK